MLVLLQLQLVDLQFIRQWWIWKAKHTSKQFLVIITKRIWRHLLTLLLHLNGFFFFGRLLRQNADKFLMEDLYRNPGPLQYDGPGADAKAVSLCVEDQDYMGRIKKLQEYLDQVCVFFYYRFIIWWYIHNFLTFWWVWSGEDDSEARMFSRRAESSTERDGFSDWCSHHYFFIFKWWSTNCLECRKRASQLFIKASMFFFA